MAAYVPPGWPPGVHPPGSEHFERTAIDWLLDVVPPDYRLYGVLRRHPVALAAMARHHLAACVEGARRGYRTTRTELGGKIPPHALDAVLAAYRSEGGRLVETARAVDLVARALAGEEFPPRLQDEPRPAPPAPVADARQPAPAHLSGPAPAPASEPALQPPPTIAGGPATPQRRARAASRAKPTEGKQQSTGRRAGETSAPDPDSRRSSPERTREQAAARRR